MAERPRTVAIVQSCYIPWKGYFDLMHSADLFVIYDDVQYTRRDWRNRNRIKTRDGVQWLTIPVEVKGHYHSPIREIRVSDAEQTLGRNVFCTLPNDYVNMMRAIDVGVPVVIESGRSPIARSFEVLGKRILDLGGEMSEPGTQRFLPRIRPLLAGR